MTNQPQYPNPSEVRPLPRDARELNALIEDIYEQARQETIAKVHDWLARTPATDLMAELEKIRNA